MDNVWNILKEYDFLLINGINRDFICILCKKILIDARVGPCGCIFCKICIENYLENGENICPGSTDECKEENLNFIKNINIDHFLNRKIAKLKINCPIESCTFSDEMRYIDQHLIGCRDIAVKCSFYENGCKFISLSGDNVDKHCKMSKDKHLQLILSEINLINKNRIELQQENEKSKAENDESKYLIKQHKTSIDEWKSNYNQLNAENASLTKQNDDYKSKYKNEINNKNNLIKYLSAYLNGNQTEFFWKINKFSEIKTMGKSPKSDKFYIFKDEIWMQLSMSCRNISVKSSHHNELLNKSCPFICNITVGIVNEITGNFIISFNEKKALSYGISFCKSIDYDQLEKAVTNDCLTVRCLTKLSSD